LIIEADIWVGVQRYTISIGKESGPLFTRKETVMVRDEWPAARTSATSGTNKVISFKVAKTNG
jgi:hypothetical protein